MSEQKVWVEKMPESCGDCEFCEKSEYYHCNYCSRLYTKLKYINREKDCPLHSIKDHDRELVKQVFNEIKEQFGFIVDGKERIICDGSATGDKTILAILNQIQQEFEDENNKN